MAQNLIQKIMEGKYNKQELTEIAEAVEYAKHNYGIIKGKIEKAQEDKFKKQKLENIEENIKNLKDQINKASKKQAKFILGLAGISFPVLIALAIVSAFNFTWFLTASAISVAGIALCAVPIGILDHKRKVLISEIDRQEKERAALLSDIFFKVSQNYANNAYNDFKQTKSSGNELENSTDNSLTI